MIGRMSGPLQGVKVVEIAGIGPGPHACMILADLGADVIRVERPGGEKLSFGKPGTNFLNRGRPSAALNLKDPRAAAVVLDLVEQADILIEGMRPGTTERLGIGPDDCWARNPRLVYGRMTGWGQDGPWSQAAGHDMNYISITGALFGLGQDQERPHFPNNLLGDFGGGSTYLVIGVLAALLEARVSGRGQVVDAAIVDGTAHLNAMGSSMLAAGMVQERRRAGLLDGGTPFYDLYETADGRHVSVGALESQFYAELIRLLGLEGVAPGQYELARWDELRELIAGTIKQQPLAHWAEVFANTDACVAPVLTQSEAVQHEHIVGRGVLVEKDGFVQPAPAPRFSRTTSELTTPPVAAGANTREALQAWGIDDVDGLLAEGIAVQA
jgi:alpha-methylacyl-CoA racemase